jgi:hypothetical protein
MRTTKLPKRIEGRVVAPESYCPKRGEEGTLQTQTL